MPERGDLLAVDRPALLVLRALGLGDLLTAVPALRALAAAFPDRRRALAAPRALAPLVALAVPGFELLATPAFVGGSPPDRALAARLPRGALAVNLHGRGPESHALLRATAPQRLIGFETDGGPAWDDDEHEVRRWCRLLQALGVPADPADLDLAPPDGAPPDPGGPTLIHPGAASPARRWPAERWAAVARGERARGRAVLLSGSAAEAPLAAAVAAHAGLPPDANRAGRTADLRALAALVAGAGRVVGGDSGVAHLATALRVPSVVLFGPTDPARWGPPPERPWHRVLWAGRTGDPHAAEPAPGLLAIDPVDVLDALSALPAAPPSPRRRPRPPSSAR
ncbi:MAG TPA: glycosyltransferase family 9 protein [Conexibacter sp.]|nr:glycosyltransferase family 9 protein [Conexibacter sp.]